MSLYYHSHGSRYVSMSADYCHVDMDMLPCLHICHFKFIIHFLVGRDPDIVSMSAYYCSHGSRYGSMDMDIITYMDLDMAPCPHITAKFGYGSMSEYYC